MIEFTSKYKRDDTSIPFCIFQTSDMELLRVEALFRSDMLAAKGFMGMSYSISEDKLRLDVVTLWESEEISFNFRSPHRERFIELVTAYNTRANHYGEVIMKTLNDTQQLKMKKLANRITAAEASQQLKSFIENKNNR